MAIFKTIAGHLLDWVGVANVPAALKALAGLKGEAGQIVQIGAVDAQGGVTALVAADKPEGGGGSGQNLAPVAKTADMTQPVGADADGLLWTVPAGDGTYFEMAAGGAPAAKGENIDVVVGSVWDGDHGVNAYFDTGYHASAKWNPEIASKIQNAPSGTYYGSYGYIHSEPYRGKVYFRLLCKNEYGTTDAYRPCIIVTDTNDLASATVLTFLAGTLHRAVATLTEGAATYYVHVWEYTIPDGQNGWVLLTPDDSSYVKTEFALPYQGLFFVNPLDDPLQGLGGSTIGGGEVVKIKDAYSYGFYANLLQDGTFRALFREYFYALAAPIGLPQTSGKSIYIGGDSLHAWAGGDGSTTEGFVTDWNRHLGANVTNAGYAGSTWTGATGGGGIQRVTELVAAGNPYDVFILAWGTNFEMTQMLDEQGDPVFDEKGDPVMIRNDGTIEDAPSNAEGCSMAAAMKWCVGQLRAAFPRSAIGIIIPPPVYTNDGMQERGDLMIEVCQLLHVPYVDMRERLTVADLQTDGVHLGAGGAAKYGAAEAELILRICPYGEAQ